MDPGSAKAEHSEYIKSRVTVLQEEKVNLQHPPALQLRQCISRFSEIAARGLPAALPAPRNSLSLTSCLPLSFCGLQSVIARFFFACPCDSGAC